MKTLLQTLNEIDKDLDLSNFFNVELKINENRILILGYYNKDIAEEIQRTYGIMPTEDKTAFSLWADYQIMNNVKISLKVKES